MPPQNKMELRAKKTVRHFALTVKRASGSIGTEAATNAGSKRRYRLQFTSHILIIGVWHIAQVNNIINFTLNVFHI